MNGPSASAAERLADLRRSFDDGFAVPSRPREEGLEQLLLIRVAGEALAIKNLHITGVAKIGRILPIPSRIPELLGITGIRGTPTPIFDLATLLGFHSGGAQSPWVALTRGEISVALAFDQVEGQVAISRASIYERQASPLREHIREVARIDQVVRAVVAIPAVVEAVRRRGGLIDMDKE